MHDGPGILGTTDLGGGADSEAFAVGAEKGRGGARVAAQVEVDVGAVLVRARQAVLRAQRVAARGAQVVD